MSVLFGFIKWRLGFAPAEVWTTADERACLARHAAGKGCLVEVGVWHGGTTRGLRAAMRPDATLYAVDPFVRGRLGLSLPRIIARTEVGKIDNGRVVWLRQSGASAARQLARSGAPVDFVFVDNAQTYETLRVEWEAWSPVVTPGGIIALHDTLPVASAPDQTSIAYARAVVRSDPRFSIVDEVETLTVLRRVH